MVIAVFNEGINRSEIFYCKGYLAATVRTKSDPVYFCGCIVHRGKLVSLGKLHYSASAPRSIALLARDKYVRRADQSESPSAVENAGGGMQRMPHKSQVFVRVYVSSVGNLSVATSPVRLSVMLPLVICPTEPDGSP